MEGATVRVEDWIDSGGDAGGLRSSIVDREYEESRVMVEEDAVRLDVYRWV